MTGFYGAFLSPQGRAFALLKTLLGTWLAGKPRDLRVEPLLVRPQRAFGATTAGRRYQHDDEA